LHQSPQEVAQRRDACDAEEGEAREVPVVPRAGDKWKRRFRLTGFCKVEGSMVSWKGRFSLCFTLRCDSVSPALVDSV
jgi:hypothetical protein